MFFPFSSVFRQNDKMYDEFDNFNCYFLEYSKIGIGSDKCFVRRIFHRIEIRETLQGVS